MKQLIEYLDQQNIHYSLNEPMKAHTTFKIGGDADILIEAESIASLSEILRICKRENIPSMILGKGSNLLVSDLGIEGAVIELTGDFKDVSVNGDVIICGAGVSLSKLCTVALDEGLSGLEFAYGIPGTVGGAVFMNAGAYNGETRDVCAEVTYLDRDGEVKTAVGDECAFGYRDSVFKKNHGIILSAKYQLAHDDPSAIKARMDDFMNRRRTKQPLEYPSAGSVFKRPKDAFAGTLIEQCGLKGARVGGAEVSQKHAGFIINADGATCDDVMGLVELVQRTVRDQTGYVLEREIIRIGR